MAEAVPSKKVVKPEQETPPSKKKSTWKYVVNIFFVLIVSGLAIYLSIKDDYNSVAHNIIQSDYIYLLVLLAVMFGFVVARSLILFCFARLFTKEYHLHQAAAVYFVGVFYAAVTPGGQGGEVMQAYTYKKQRIQISCAVSALAMHSILFQIVLILYGIISLIVKYDFLSGLPNANLGKIGSWTVEIPMWVLTLLGFMLNVGYIGLVFLMCYFKPFHRFIMGPIITLLNKIRIVKNPDGARESMRAQLENFKIELRRLFSNVPFTILVSILFFISMTLGFATPYFVGLAMHNQSTCASFWDAVFLGNYHQMATGLIPIPGSAGISEFVFRSIFCSYPAVPQTSFYFVEASVDSCGRWFYEVTHNPTAYESDWLVFSNYFSELKNSGIDVTTFSYEMSNMKDMGLHELAADSPYRIFITYYANFRESSSLANAAMIMWRTVTFTLPLAVSGFVTAFYRASPKNEPVDSKRMAGRHTLVALQNETFVERARMAETMIETSRLTRESIKKRLISLSRNDRRKKLRERRKRNKEQAPMEYSDVNIKEEDDSL